MLSLRLGFVTQGRDRKEKGQRVSTQLVLSETHTLRKTHTLFYIFAQTDDGMG